MGRYGLPSCLRCRSSGARCRPHQKPRTSPGRAEGELHKESTLRLEVRRHQLAAECGLAAFWPAPWTCFMVDYFLLYYLSGWILKRLPGSGLSIPIENARGCMGPGNAGHCSGSQECVQSPCSAERSYTRTRLHILGVARATRMISLTVAARAIGKRLLTL